MPPSTDLVYTPTVVDNSGTPVDFDQGVNLTFNSGALDHTNSAGGLTLYLAGTDIGIDATDGSIGSSPTGTLTVTVNHTTRDRLEISGPSVITAGVPVNLTIRAVDLYGNVDASYDSPPAKKLVFYGAAVAPDGSNYPTVTANNGTAKAFGQDTSIDFASGVSSVSGSNNGVMTLVAVESTTINVLDKNDLSLNSEPYGGLTVTVLQG